jgi:hypothetical protein
MSVTKKTYTIGSVQQLIDLNGDTTNFDCLFNVTSRGKEEFEVLVIDQKTLDSGKKIEYRKAKESISGNITQDKDIHDHYYLILKSDKPCEVDVEITKTKIDAKYVPPQRKSTLQNPIQNPMQKNQMQNPVIQNSQMKQINSDESYFSTGSIIKYVLLGIVLIVGGYLLYYFYNKKQPYKYDSEIKPLNSYIRPSLNIDKSKFVHSSPSIQSPSPSESSNSSVGRSPYNPNSIGNSFDPVKDMGVDYNDSLFSRLQSARI